MQAINQRARASRLAVLERISELERQGLFDRDAENDPPTVPLLPGSVDYTGKKLSSRIGTLIANRVAHAFFERKIKKGELVIREVRGIEHFLAVKGGAILTCNHFNPFDNYAVFKEVFNSFCSCWHVSNFNIELCTVCNDFLCFFKCNFVLSSTRESNINLNTPRFLSWEEFSTEFVCIILNFITS